MEILKKAIFEIDSAGRFDEICMDVFAFQAKNNPAYREYLSLLGTDISAVGSPDLIPALPIRFFKSRRVVSSAGPEEIVFTSSATTGMIPSRHYVTDTALYERSFTGGFRLFYGDPAGYVILALLPSYLERKGSSLVYMAEKLIQMSGEPESGFYLYNYPDLYALLEKLKSEGRKTILLGVSFALLDFVASFKTDFPGLTVIETGGMKGRGRELSREELHNKLAAGFGTAHIHSEYGMAELLSQAYSVKGGLFRTPPWMRVLVRNLYNPFEYYTNYDISPSGGINVIDLANLNSCSFIETEDRGRVYSDGSFTIEGRIQDSELRGCNLLLEPL